ncbi:uncharacterized protein LOC118403484 [Branchiostoma floridae]|uniref:Uncharacterized protein LOC118403484 n=1 Tax=Branchiostoma floridae TaxID=7739 RepID=A0A9J7HGS9_BRAFL|nr:uncharacterized protein LOC118403484 [Branchiostoma floridae]
MVGITGTTYRALCPIILLWIGSASALRRAICPPGKDGSSSDRTIYFVAVGSTSPPLGQSQELRCAYPYSQPHGWNHDLGVGLELLWFKDNDLMKGSKVSNTSDGRITITEDVVNVPDNIRHLCSRQLDQETKKTKSFRSILSIHNIEHSDYGVYNCHLVINNKYKEIIHSTRLKGPYSRPKILYPKLSNMCKTTLTCEVACVDCCPCDTGLCEMVLLKDNRVVTSTTSVITDRHKFKSTLKISIDGPKDYDLYKCVLKQLAMAVDCQDGSMIENWNVGSSFRLYQPKAYATKPHRAFTNAEGAHVSCLFEKRSLPASLTGTIGKTWEVVLRKDHHKEIASKETSVSPDGTVQASFSLKRTLEVYGEYQCVIRPTHHGCKNQSWSESSNMLIFESPTVLQPHTVPSWMRTTTKHGCAFLIEHREVDRYAIVVTSQGNEVSTFAVATNGFDTVTSLSITTKVDTP